MVLSYASSNVFEVILFNNVLAVHYLFPGPSPSSRMIRWAATLFPGRRTLLRRRIPMTVRLYSGWPQARAIMSFACGENSRALPQAGWRSPVAASPLIRIGCATWRGRPAARCPTACLPAAPRIAAFTFGGKLSRVGNLPFCAPSTPRSGG